MKPVRLALHLGLDVLVIAGAIGIPVLCSGYGRSVVSGTDAVSSASVVIDAPSGAFTVLLNEDRLEERDFWRAFFAGEEVDFCFEDISCTVARTDPAALTMAQSFASRLAEHQMTIRQEDMTLMLSKADHGNMQVIILSEELALHYAALSGLPAGIRAVDVTSQEETT